MRFAKCVAVVIIMVTIPLAVAAQVDWETVVEEALGLVERGYCDWGEGEVDTVSASIFIDVEEPELLTLDVNINWDLTPESSEVDAYLSLFDSDGRLIAESHKYYGGTPLIQEAWIEAPGIYYAVVTAYSSRPEIDDAGYFAGFSGSGDGQFAFSLEVVYGEWGGGP